MYIHTGGQSCIENPNVNQQGSNYWNSGRQVIVPNTRINCTGRITGIAVSMAYGGWLTNNHPSIQIWRPSPGSSVYNRIYQVAVDFGTSIDGSYYIDNLTVNGIVQTGDVIGYYQPSFPRRVILNIQTSGYTSYSSANYPGTTIDINNVDTVLSNRQPLIELQFGKSTYVSLLCCYKLLQANHHNL